MTDAVETMAWAGQVPWHGLGNKVSSDQTPAQMQKAAGLNWTVSKRPTYFKKADGSESVILNEVALVRDTDQSHLSNVGTDWKPVQNDAALGFFKQWTEAGKMTMETAGALWGGRYVWALARVGKDFTLGKADKVLSYLLLMSPHMHGKAMVVQFTTVRVVCWNTLSMALGADMKGHANAFRMPHTMEFNESVQNNAKVALGLAVDQADTFKEAATLLSKKKAAPKKVEEYFAEVLRFDPKKADKKAGGEVKEPRMLPRFRQALEHGPGQQINTALGTWWGAVNAVTFTIDHAVGRERDTALKGAWFGSHADLKRRAFDLALKAAA